MFHAFLGLDSIHQIFKMSNIYIKEPSTDGKVMLHTSLGDVDIELWSKEAPMACRNFIQLSMEGYYDKVIFHRVVPGFIVQGGDPTGTGEGGESVYGKPFKDEIHQRLRFVRRGLVAMANAGPNDNGSQFFFTLGPCNDLNKKHTIFGKVTGDTVYNMIRLGEVDTDENERPLNPPFIKFSKVLANPFEDIEPRFVPDRKKLKDEQKKAKSNSRATKDYKLLSFGEEAEVDEEESAEFSFKGSKSSHDLAKDPKLSSVAAVPLERDEDESMKRSRDDVDTSEDEDSSSDGGKKNEDLDTIRNKLKGKKSKLDDQEEPKNDSKEKDSKNEKASPKRNRAEELRRESKKIARELLGKNTSDKKEEGISASNSDDKDARASQNPMFAEYKAQQKTYREKTSENKKKGSSREQETLAMLNSFQSKITAVRGEAGSDDSKGTLRKDESDDDDDDEEGWMLHTLTRTEDTLRDAKDMNKDVNEDRYDIFDPRNPLNQRRREKGKKDSKKTDRRDKKRDSSQSSGHHRSQDRRR